MSEGHVHVFSLPNSKWRWRFASDPHSFQVHMGGKPPNRFHRFMLRWFLGIHTELINE